MAQDRSLRKQGALENSALQCSHTLFYLRFCPLNCSQTLRPSTKAQRVLIDLPTYVARIRKVAVLILASQNEWRTTKAGRGYCFYIAIQETKRSGFSVDIDLDRHELLTLNDLVRVPVASVPGCNSEHSLRRELCDLCKMSFITYGNYLWLSVDNLPSSNPQTPTLKQPPAITPKEYLQVRLNEISSKAAAGVQFARDSDGAIRGLFIPGDNAAVYLMHGRATAAKDASIWSTHECYHKVLLGGDLLFFATALGRTGCSNYWCLFCRTMRAMWQAEVGGQLPGGEVMDSWTLDKMGKRRREVFAKKVKKSLKETKKMEENLGTKREGFRFEQDELFGIDVCDLVMPCLHLALGLVKDIWDELEEFVVTNVQECSDDLRQKRVKVYSLMRTVDDFETTLFEDMLRTANEDWAGSLKKRKHELDVLNTELQGLVTAGATKRQTEEVERKLKTASNKVLQAQKKMSEAEDNTTKLKARQAQAEKDLTAAKKVQETALKKEPVGKCEVAMTEILAEFKISREVYFGGAFIGPACKLLTENSEKIFERLRSRLKSLKKDGVSDSFIDDALWKFDALLREFDVCTSVMRSTVMQSDDEIAAFKASAKRFVELWKKSFKRRPPKLHVLETHVCEQLERYGVLGLFSEDPIERLHHQHAVATRRACNIREYVKREKYLQSRSAALNSAPAQAVVQFAANKRKRATSAKTTAKKEAKMEKKVSAKTVKRERNESFYEQGKYI